MPATNIKKCIIVMGQSQVDGRGNSPTCPQASADGTIVGVDCYNQQTGTIAPWKIGTNTGSFTYNSSEWGPDYVAVKQYRDWLGEDLTVVKATRGGASMGANANTTACFAIPSVAVTNGASLVAEWGVERWNRARAIYARSGIILDPIAILWMQGEGDYQSPYQEAYQMNMTNYMKFVRRYLGKPSLPWIWTSVQSDSPQYSATVYAAQQAIHAADVNSKYLTITGQSYNVDGVHYDYNGKLYIGNWMFDQLKTI